MAWSAITLLIESKLYIYVGASFQLSILWPINGKNSQREYKMGLFSDWKKNSFKKTVRGILLKSIPDLNKIEDSLPQSTVENSYNTAWESIGKDAIKMHPSIYMEECLRSANFVLEMHLTASELFLGRMTSQKEI